MYKIESNGLVTGPRKGQCAGYIFNFAGHGAYDPTGLIKVGTLHLTKAQVDAHNALLAQAEREGMIKNGRGTFYLTYTTDKPSSRWQYQTAISNLKVSQWSGSWQAPWAYVERKQSYGFCYTEARYVWFTGPDGKKWYGVNKGDQDCFNARRFKVSA